jgi:hypothetical protein
MDGTHWEDDRVARRNLAGVLVGALSGLLLAVLLVYSWTAPGDRWPLLLGLIGAAAGALLGRLLATTVTPEEIEPTVSNRPFVGSHTPDDDTAPDPAPAPRKL